MKGAGNEGEKAWVATMTDIAYDVENVIHKFMYQISREGISGRSLRFLCHTIYFPKTLWESGRGIKLQACYKQSRTKYNFGLKLK